MTDECSSFLPGITLAASVLSPQYLFFPHKESATVAGLLYPLGLPFLHQFSKLRFHFEAWSSILYATVRTTNKRERKVKTFQSLFISLLTLGTPATKLHFLSFFTPSLCSILCQLFQLLLLSFEVFVPRHLFWEYWGHFHFILNLFDSLTVISGLLRALNQLLSSNRSREIWTFTTGRVIHSYSSSFLTLSGLEVLQFLSLVLKWPASLV